MHACTSGRKRRTWPTKASHRGLPGSRLEAPSFFALLCDCCDRRERRLRAWLLGQRGRESPAFATLLKLCLGSERRRDRWPRGESGVCFCACMRVRACVCVWAPVCIKVVVQGTGGRLKITLKIYSVNYPVSEAERMYVYSTHRSMTSLLCLVS